MDRRTLAEELSNAGAVPEICALLETNRELADRELAERLKDICYESWNSEPARARGAAAAAEQLALLEDDAEISASANWIAGIAELTRGELDSAVSRIRDGVKGFAAAGNRIASAQASVAMLIPLSLLGRYEEAVQAGSAALDVFDSEGDDLAAGKIELNLSNIASRKGDHRSAESRGLAALDRFRNAGENEWIALAENDLANTYAELADLGRAEEFYELALEHAGSSGMSVTVAEIEASLGNLATFRGHFDKALNLLETSRRRFEDLDMPHQTAIAELEIAGIYQTLNLVSEAAEIQSAAADRLRELGLQGEEARARAGLGRLRIALGDQEGAVSELLRAEKLFGKEGRNEGTGEVQLIRARVQMESGDPGAALETIRSADGMLGPDPSRLRNELLFIEGEVLRTLGDAEGAGELFKAARMGASGIDNPVVEVFALNSLGLLDQEKGDHDAAESGFRSAIELIESMREPIAAEEFRMAYLADKLEPYDNLAQSLLKRGKLAEALETLERARARTLAEAVAGAPASLADDTSGLRQVKQETREKLNWLYSRISRALDEVDREALRQRAVEIEKKLADITRRIESTRVGTAYRQTDFSVADLQSVLGEERALIEYVENEGEISAFAVTADDLAFIPALAHQDDILSALESMQFQFGALRFGSDRLGGFHQQLKTRTERHLADLRKMVLEPLDGLVGNRDLVVVPAGSLNYVPFPGLFDGERYEAERREIVSCPGASVWLALEQRHSRDLASALVFGVEDEQIPNVEAEVSAVSELFRESRVFKGAEASFESYSKNASHFDVIHLACHGQFRADSPLYSSLHLADGSVTVRDICEKEIAADLVTLSACETGMSSVFPGEEILGLARGFLAAGASTIVLSLWTVSDRAALELTTAMYRGIRGGSRPSRALNDARKTMIARGEHPYYWAPFGIIGRQ